MGAAELLVARALGAEWLDHYVADWRLVRPEITGDDLLEAGVPEGPALGRGLAAALAARLDGEAAGARPRCASRSRPRAARWHPERMDWRSATACRWLEAELPGARAAFSTRRGGVSERPFESLNLGLLTGDEPGRVRENRHRAVGAAGVDPERVLIGRQVHGAERPAPRRAARGHGFAEPGPALPRGRRPGDARTTGLAPLVFVADCLPVALAGPGGVAMIHCGWRGLAAGIVERGARAVGAAAAAIGPGIGPCCYEVGEEVLAAFAAPGRGDRRGSHARPARGRAPPARRGGRRAVEIAGCARAATPELFFSHRRDGERTGRQARAG